MARTENHGPGRLLKVRHLILLLWIPFVLDACTHAVQPRYQPISESSIWRPPFQGYGSRQIDERTHLIVYQNYFSSIPVKGKWADFTDEKWLKGAQEYVLYRAGELAKSKGAQSFVVLHKDDWNQVAYSSGRYGGPWFMPSAMALIRILDKNASSIPVDGEYVYEADKLLDSLAKQNIGLAEHRGISLPHEGTGTIADNRVIRWRSSVIISDSVPTPSLGQSDWMFGLLYSPKTEITKVSSGVFDIGMSGPYMVSPIELLLECVKLADREGYGAFKLENWTVEEHRDRDLTHRRIWFKTKAHAVLQHHQENSESREPVFVVEEIRSNIDTENPQKKR
jgi:hypothetical protein